MSDAPKPSRPRHQTKAKLATRLTGVGFWERDLATGHEQWDARVCALFGTDPSARTSPQRPITQSVTAFMAPADRERLDAALAASTASHMPGECRFHLVRPDGSMAALRSAWELELDDDGRAVRLLGVLTDETPTDELSHQSTLLSTRLNESLNLAKVGCWHARLPDEHHFWDERACEIAGVPYRPEGFTAAEVRQWVHPSSRAIIKASMAKAVAADEPVEFEYLHMRPSGELRHVLIRQLRERDPSGRVVRLFGAALDVTEQRQRELALASSVRDLEAALSLGKVGYWRKNLLTHEVVWNGPVRELYGLAPGEAPSQEKFERLLSPADLARIQTLDASLHDSRMDRTEFSAWITWPNGERRFIYSAARVQRNAQGVPAELVGVAVDLTAERSALVQAHDSAQRFRQALDLAQLGTFRMNLATGEEEFDERCWEITGLAPRPGGWNVQDVLAQAASQADVAVIQAADQRTITTGSSGEYQYNLLRPDGAPRRVLCSTRLELDAAGQPAFLYGVAADITSHFEQAEEHRQVAVRLARACELAQVGVFDRDLTTGVSLWNDVLYRLYGLAPGGPSGPEVLDTLMSPADAQARRDAVARLIRGETDRATLRFAITRPSDGERRELCMQFLGWKGVHDLVVRIIGTVTDITAAGTR